MFSERKKRQDVVLILTFENSVVDKGENEIAEENVVHLLRLKSECNGTNESHSLELVEA